MLKNISFVISPDLLWLLAPVGHDETWYSSIVVSPQSRLPNRPRRAGLLNYPTQHPAGHARHSLCLMPLDHFVEEPVTRMRVMDDPDSLLEIQRQVIEIVRQAEGREVKIGALERFAFYLKSQAEGPRSCVPPNSVLTVVSFVRWALFLTADE